MRIRNIRVTLMVAAGLLPAFTACNHSDKDLENPTFSRDIAPIIYRNCTSCHRPGSAGPFSLITYADVRRKAQTIEAAVQSRFMPPWPADTSYSHFVGEMGLTQRQIDMITNWVAHQCPIGDSANIPPPPQFPEGSLLGTPDMVLHFPPLHVEGNDTDHFFLVKIPYEMPEAKYVRTIEFVPGNKKLLHHMNANLIEYEPGAKQNVFGGKKVIPTNLAEDAMSLQVEMDNLNDDGSVPHLQLYVSNYLPGAFPPVYPKGIGGFTMTAKGAFFINDIHYGPSPVDTTDTSSCFNIFFSNSPPGRPTSDILLGSLSKVAPVQPALVIPPNTIKTFHIKYRVQQDLSILTLNAHMHLLGKEYLAYAVTPENDTIHLIHIPKWDFRWQYFYTFTHPVKVPAGSMIVVEATYDNTADNPNNPYSPPRVIVDRGGAFDSMKTTNEMLQLIITAMPYEPGDEKIDLAHASLQ